MTESSERIYKLGMNAIDTSSNITDQVVRAFAAIIADGDTEWTEATEVDSPELAKKHIGQLYSWLRAWQGWARQILEEKGLQLKDGHYGDLEARAILGRILSDDALKELHGSPEDSILQKEE